MRCQAFILSLSILLTIALCTGDAAAGTLKTHGIFSSHMVIQRDQPITIWGWAEPGQKVSVQFGQEKAEATAGGEAGGWEVTFPPQQANATGQKLVVTAGDETIEMENLLIGNIWVMNGQSNMAFGLRAVYQAAFESSMAHLSLLRHIRIRGGAESEFVETDIPDDMGSLIEGFAIADAAGNYYMAQAEAKPVKEKEMRNKQILVSSPLVKEPVSVRYAWARSPMGNLKVEGKPWQPLHSFRTDTWDFYAEVEHSDPDGKQKNSEAIKEMRDQAKACLARRLEAET